MEGVIVIAAVVFLGLVVARLVSGTPGIRGISEDTTDSPDLDEDIRRYSAGSTTPVEDPTEPEDVR